MSNSFGIIYKATNLINGKCYVGQTVKKLKYRIKEHIRCSYRNTKRDYFHSSLKKHGSDIFEWDVLCECLSRDDLDEKEKYYIQKLNTLAPNGYNLTIGGSGKSGFIPSEKTRKILSEKYIGKGNPFYGKKHSEKSKQIISYKGQGRIISKETLEKRSKSMLGKNKRTHSKEQNKNHSEIMKKYTNETIEKCIELKLSGKTHKEISNLLNIPLGTVQWWWNKNKVGGVWSEI